MLITTDNLNNHGHLLATDWKINLGRLPRQVAITAPELAAQSRPKNKPGKMIKLWNRS